MNLIAIGHVRCSAPEGMDCQEMESVIEVLPEFEEGLHLIEENQEILVLYILHRARFRALKVHPKGDPSIPLHGVFATRTPNRPNRIGLTKVTLLRREGNLLYVKGMDALDGSPVIDIKPVIRLDQRDISQK
jgi:tRNA-Thr(GGU) m(6)t(6)A37 methyltransferase TsaA